MSLTHTPALVVAELLKDKLKFTDPSGLREGAEMFWPVYAAGLLDTPDDAVGLVDTAGPVSGTAHEDGQVFEHYGIQVEVRSFNHNAAWKQITDIAKEAARANQLQYSVESMPYMLHALARTSGFAYIGEDDLRRRRFVTNFIAAISQLA